MDDILVLLYLMIATSVAIMIGLVWAVNDTSWDSLWPVACFVAAIGIVLGLVLGVMP